MESKPDPFDSYISEFNKHSSFTKIVKIGDLSGLINNFILIQKPTESNGIYILCNFKKNIKDIAKKFYKILENNNNTQNPNISDLISIYYDSHDLVINQLHEIYGADKQVMNTQWVEDDDTLRKTGIQMIIETMIIHKIKLNMPTINKIS